MSVAVCAAGASPVRKAPGGAARRFARAAVSLAFAGGLVGCSLGEGSGDVTSDRLIAKDCWGVDPGQPSGYDLQPNFFAAVPYRSTLLIRVQRGSDQEEVSDGMMVLVDDIQPIRAEIQAANAEGRPPRSLRVSLPPGVVPSGSPVIPPDPTLPISIVHMALYLQRSCHNQNTTLYAVSGHLTFSSLFSGDPAESDATQKYTSASFDDVEVGDIHDVPLGAAATAVPPELQSLLKGSFSFYFERGQPGQPFP